MADCPWDLNGDGVVDDADLAWLTAHWGTCTPGSKGDFNSDGYINNDDIAILQSHYGPCPNGGTEIKTTSLTEGNHDIQISLVGYETLVAVINVSSTAISCVSVAGGTLKTSGWTVAAYMKEGTGTTARCTWVATKDTSKVAFISEMVLAYNNLMSIGFTPTADEIGKAVLMYSNLGTPASLWGC